MAVRYDPSTGPSGGPQRGALALRDHYTEVTGLGDMGVYNPRRIRGRRSWSIHASGRAVDHKANVHEDDEKWLANLYCAFLIWAAIRLQCQLFIWNRQSWKSGRGWANYGGAHPHEDHIHSELNRDGGRTVTLTLLRDLWSEFESVRDLQEEPVTEVEIIKAFVAWLKRDPSDEELELHTLAATDRGLAEHLLAIARSDEAKAKR